MGGISVRHKQHQYEGVGIISGVSGSVAAAANSGIRQ